MKMKKAVRMFIGANVLLVMTFVLLPALLVNPDIEILQSVLNYITKD